MCDGQLRRGERAAYGFCCNLGIVEGAVIGVGRGRRAEEVPTPLRRGRRGIYILPLDTDLLDLLESALAGLELGLGLFG